MRRTVLLLTALVLLVAGGLILWHYSGCQIIGGKFCTQSTAQLDLSGQPFREGEKLAAMESLKQLDLRDSGMTVEEFDVLQAALPQCSIAWSVPFQGGYYPHDTRHLSVSTLTGEDLRMLSYFPKLESVDATGCADLSAVAKLMEVYPALLVDYLVPLGGELVSPQAQELTLGSDSVQALEQALRMLPQVREVDATQCPDYVGLFALQQRYPQIQIRYTVTIDGGTAEYSATELSVDSPVLEQLERALGCLPNLQALTLTGKLPSSEQLHALQLKFPHISFRWSFSLCGVTVSTMDKTLNLSGIAMESVDQVEKALAWFNCLETVEMCGCSIPSEEMAALAQRNPAIRFIWTVNIGKKIQIRTDAEYLMPFRYGVTLTDEDIGELKYCTDMICLDLGHSLISDVSFLTYMPKLQYLTLGETPVSDISAMAGLENLVFLELFLTKVQDYSPLLSCPNLRDLNISYAIPKDMTVLCQLKQVKHMHLKGLWQDEWKQQLMQALPETTFVFAGTGDISSTGDGWRKLENYYRMRDILDMPYMSY